MNRGTLEQSRAIFAMAVKRHVTKRQLEPGSAVVKQLDMRPVVGLGSLQACLPEASWTDTNDVPSSGQLPGPRHHFLSKRNPPVP